MHGVSQEAFHDSYRKKYHEYFTVDNRYGKIMFFLHRIVSSSNLISRASINILKHEAEQPDVRYWLSDILWHMFAGDKPYRRIFRKTFIFKKLLLFLKNIFRK